MVQAHQDEFGGAGQTVELLGLRDAGVGVTDTSTPLPHRSQPIGGMVDAWEARPSAVSGLLARTLHQATGSCWPDADVSQPRRRTTLRSRSPSAPSSAPTTRTGQPRPCSSRNCSACWGCQATCRRPSLTSSWTPSVSTCGSCTPSACARPASTTTATHSRRTASPNVALEPAVGGRSRGPACRCALVQRHPCARRRQRGRHRGPWPAGPWSTEDLGEPLHASSGTAHGVCSWTKAVSAST